MGAPLPFSGRIMAAIIGVITVTLSFPVYRTLARSLFPEREVAWVSLVGTFALATLFSHVTWSRAGMEGIPTSMFSLLVAWTTWLAFDQRSYRWAGITGAVLGLSLYTYVAAQAVVGVVILYAVLRAIHARNEEGGVPEIVRLSAVLFITAAVIYAPLAITILRAPDQFFRQLRGTSVSTFHGDIFAVGQRILVNAWRTVAGISLRGDLSEGRNLPGRPLLDSFASLLHWLGMFTAVGAVRRSSVYQLILVWLSVTLLPVIFSDEAPNFMRLLSAAPAFTFLVGVGFAQLWHLSTRFGFLNTRIGSRTCLVILIFGGLFSMQRTISDYFGGWGTEKVPFNMFPASPRRTVELARDLTDGNIVYLTPSDDPILKPTVDLFLRDTDVRQINSQICMPLAWSNPDPVIYGIVTIADKNAFDRLNTLYPNARIIAELYDSSYPWLYSQFLEIHPGSIPVLSMTTVQADFSGGLNLKGFSLSATEVTPGDTVVVDIYWQVVTTPIAELMSFVHIAHADALLPVAQHDGSPCSRAFPTTQWMQGEVYLDQHFVQIPHELESSHLQVRVGLYDWPSLARNSINATDMSRVMEDILVIGSIKVVGP